MASSSSTGARAQGHAKAIDKDVLSRIRHLDVTENITDRSRTTVAHGGFSEVFKGRLRKDGTERPEADVAIKRLRFHVNEEKIKEVRLILALLKYLAG